MIYFIQNQVTVPPEQVDFPIPARGKSGTSRLVRGSMPVG